MGESRQRYPEEFKKETVKYIQQHSKSVADIAEELNISSGVVRQWLAKYRTFENEPMLDVKVSATQEKIKEQEQELKAKAAEIDDLKEEIEILKNALLQQRPEVSFQFIENHRSKFRVEKMCKTLSVSRSGYYKWRKASPGELEKRRMRLTKRIVHHYEDSNGLYGSPKITRLLWREGWKVSEKTVGRLMRESGIRSRTIKKFRVNTTDSNHSFAVASNILNQNFTASKPNEVWVADITYSTPS